MSEWRLEINIPQDTQAAIANCKDKRGLGMAIARAMDRENELTVNLIQQRISGELLHVRSGLLRDSIQRTDAIVTDSAVSSAVGSNVRSGGESVAYAAPLEFGSRPHLIRPKPERGPRAALRFGMGGKLVFAKSVNHPGNRAYSFVRGTVEERMGNYSRSIGGAAFKFVTGGQTP